MSVEMLILVLLASLTAAPVQQAPERPRPATRDYVVEVDYDPPPDSLEGLYDASMVIVRARIGASQPRMIKDMPVTTSSAQVLEVLKGDDISEGQQIAITLPIGSATVGGHKAMTSAHGFEGVAEGTEAVLFLERWPAAGTFGLKHGPAGVYQLNADSVRMPAAAARWAAFANRPTPSRADFLTIMRQLKTAKREK